MLAQLQQGSTFGSYQVLTPLGHGSFGEVYLASHRVLRRRVALKLLRADDELLEETKELFLREARVIASFHHPRIVEVYDAGEAEGRLYLALRFFPGGTVEDLMRSCGGRLDEQRTLELVRDIAEGLEVIEQLGMVHRDIKPSNILLDDQGRGTITDLGTALVSREVMSGDESEARTRRPAAPSLAGTPLFFAPELCMQGVMANASTDLYALGVTMYACLTGKMPYQARHLMALFKQIVSEPFPDVKAQRTDLRLATVELLERLTARDPNNRFQRASAVLDTVTEMLGERRSPYHTPQPRASLDDVTQLATQLWTSPIVKTLMEALPSPSLVLNASRQIIAVNGLALTFLGLGSETEIMGKRPGEAFGCVEVPFGTDGCGTAPKCRLCGLGKAVSDAAHECPLPMERPCHITTENRFERNALDVQARLTALPLSGNEALYLVALSDMSESLRRRMLNKVFFEEMLTNAQTVRELSAEIRGQSSGTESNLAQLSGKLICSAEDLFDQIVYQHQAIAAEEGDLQPVPEHTDLGNLLQWVWDWWQRHPSSRSVRLTVRPGQALSMRTDTMLLRRTLTTLLEGEREWVPAGGELEIGFDNSNDGRVRLWLHHGGAMTSEERMQLFKREARITSRRDRGPFTFLARLLIEQYLCGKLTVASEPAKGTWYWLVLPTDLGELVRPQQ